MGCLLLGSPVAVFMALGSLFFGTILFFGWNLVFSPIFSLPEVTFFQAWLGGIVISAICGSLRTTVTTK